MSRGPWKKIKRVVSIDDTTKHLLERQKIIASDERYFRAVWPILDSESRARALSVRVKPSAQSWIADIDAT